MALIAVVDDSKYIQLLLKDYLEQEGYTNFVTFDNAEDYYSWMETEEAEELDLLLLDWVLPGGDGLEVVEKMKANSRLEDIPVLMVTKKTEPEYLREAFEAGCRDYVRKPIEDVELGARVNGALRLKKARDKQKKQLKELREARRELQQANAKLEERARIDALTELLNKRGFTQELHKEWDRAKREKEPISLVMVDVDYFKPYNDNYGHEAGDDVLSKLGEVLSDSLLRPGDSAARYGGEEFALILPETDVTGAKHVASRVRENVENLEIEHEARPAPEVITVSLGICTLEPGESETEGETLVKKADNALYEAKEKGRNRVCVYSEKIS